MAIETLAFPATGSDRKRYTVRLTGNVIQLGYDDSGNPIRKLVAPLHKWTVDGDHGVVAKIGKGRFHLGKSGVEVTMDDINEDLSPA